MNVIFLGPPGAGKGTQADFICNKLNIAKISTGDILRAIIRNPAADPEIKRILTSGQLVPDATVLGLVKHQINQPECANGFLLDGFPRTIAQAEELQKILQSEGKKIDFIIEILVPDAEIIKRLDGRRVHKSSGRTYHVLYNPPKVENTDDVTGEPLIQRDDDKAETVIKRLEVYHDQTEPLIAWYQKACETDESSKYIPIDSEGGPDEVSDAIWSKLFPPMRTASS